MDILLIRHGESQANIDQTLHQSLPDHEIALSTRGQSQPAHAAKHVYDFYFHRYGYDYVNGLLWNSPYRRTRDTADILLDNLKDKNLVLRRRENILLCEQQFGLFDGLEDDEIEKRYPNEYNTWMLCKQYNGKFWARYPMGESPFDAAVRVRQGIDEIKKNNNEFNVVVCHGTVVKLFVMMYFNYSPEWFAEEKTIGNCGIYLIRDDKDCGRLFGGFKKGELVG